MADNALTARQKSIAEAASYAARGDQTGLKQALIQGLDAGITVNEFKEILIQAYAYCGFPRSLNALNTLMQTEEERGNKDPQGPLPGPKPEGTSLEYGTKNQTSLIGSPVSGKLYEFAPAIDEYLKSHLFGDIFARDNIDWQTRELATIAMLASLDGTESQLNSHIQIGKHNGLTDNQVSFITYIFDNRFVKLISADPNSPCHNHIPVRNNGDLGSSAADIPAGSMNYCDGVGLLRTENFFLDTGSFPDEQAQFEVYKDAVLAACGKPVTIRTLDLGGDKTLNMMKEANKEENPFMGYRAIRFCLDHKDIFLTQLKAILRASAFGTVKILLPMICSIREVERSRLLIEQAKEELAAANIAFDKHIQVGAMIEVPSAAMTADVICDVCDFISIGTNDLIQYILAVDRVNDMVAYLYEPTHPAVIRTLDIVVSAAEKAGIPVCVCGELAADPIFAPLLLGMGVTEFSMSPTAVSEIKFLLRKTSSDKAKGLRNEVLSLKRARHIISRLRSYHYEAMQPYIK